MKDSIVDVVEDGTQFLLIFQNINLAESGLILGAFVP
jgi:hypothetical protein